MEPFAAAGDRLLAASNGSLGPPVRYPGYLPTGPPHRGRESMIGRRATNAWAHGLDTRRTNGLASIPPTTRWSTSRYIVVGFGRDYADVRRCGEASTPTRRKL